MAEPTACFDVSVEAVLHKALQRLFEELAQEHRVLIDAVDVEWRESLNDFPRIAELRVTSRYRGP